MANTRFSSSNFRSSLLKYDSMNTGYPALMAAPTATDAGTGTSVSVAFTAQSGATSYTAISTPGSFTGTGSSSPITVSGLTSGTAYTFQIRATNSVGTGAYSAASNSVTPIVPGQFESIATLNGAGLGFPRVTFNSIPQTYKHLQLRIASRSTYPAGFTGASGIYVNGVESNAYQSSGFYAQNAVITKDITAGDASVRSGFGIVTPADNQTAYYHGVSIVDIHNYSDTTNKKSFNLFGGNSSAVVSTDRIALSSGSSMNTDAITSVTIIDGFGSGFTTTSTFALYGIKGS